MKRYILMFALLALFVGCNSEYGTYSGESVLFLDVDRTLKADTTRVSFTYIDGIETTDSAKILVKLIGEVTNYDREFTIKIDMKNCTTADFEPISTKQILPAGQPTMTIDVVLNRTEALKQEAKFFDLILVESPNFKVLYQDETSSETGNVQISRVRHTFVFSELLSEAPANWNLYYFGAFSFKKFTTICDLMDISRSKFVDRKYMTFGRVSYVATAMKEKFAALAAAGTPILDENGQPMKMGDKI